MLLIAGVVGWSAYSYWWEYSQQAAKRARESMAPTIGAQCYVIFRSEEIGTSHAMLKPASINGVENSVRGTFAMLNDEWIVLNDANKQQLWIPREHVLLIRVEP